MRQGEEGSEHEEEPATYIFAILVTQSYKKRDKKVKWKEILPCLYTLKEGHWQVNATLDFGASVGKDTSKDTTQ